MTWRDQAACLHHDPELWFSDAPPRPHLVAMAKEICGRCPVGGQCLEEADRVGAVGIWGGLTAAERDLSPSRPPHEWKKRRIDRVARMLSDEMSLGVRPAQAAKSLGVSLSGLERALLRGGHHDLARAVRADRAVTS